MKRISRSQCTNISNYRGCTSKIRNGGKKVCIDYCDFANGNISRVLAFPVNCLLCVDKCLPVCKKKKKM